jgi:hypothetical protein
MLIAGWISTHAPHRSYILVKDESEYSVVRRFLQEAVEGKTMTVGN